MIKSFFVEITDLRFKLHSDCRVFTSLEGLNPGRSIKDRMVKHEIVEQMKAGKLKRGDRIVEASAGSTAYALAYYAHHYELNCTLFVPDSFPKDGLSCLRALNTSVFPVSAREAYPKLDEFLKKNPDAYHLNQLGNPTLSRHYASLGRDALDKIGSIDCLIGTVGTGLSLKGIAEGMESEQSEVCALKITAEPVSGSVSEIRNIETTRYGPGDACKVCWFDRRILLRPDQYFTGLSVETNLGPIRFSESFGLVLGAAQVLFKEGKHQGTFFLIGSENQRI